MTTLSELVQDMDGELGHLQWLMSCDPKAIREVLKVVDKASIDDRTYVVKTLHNRLADMKDRVNNFEQSLRCYVATMGTLKPNGNVHIEFVPEDLVVRNVAVNNQYRTEVTYVANHFLKNEHVLETRLTYELKDNHFGNLAIIYDNIVTDMMQQLPNLPILSEEKVKEMLTYEDFDRELFDSIDTIYTLLEELGIDTESFTRNLMRAILSWMNQRIMVGSEYESHLYDFIKRHINRFGDVYNIYLDEHGFVIARPLNTKTGEVKKVHYIFTKTAMGSLISVGEKSTVYKRYQLMQQCSE